MLPATPMSVYYHDKKATLPSKVKIGSGPPLLVRKTVPLIQTSGEQTLRHWTGLNERKELA
jgi:hypothetical protein